MALRSEMGFPFSLCVDTAAIFQFDQYIFITDTALLQDGAKVEFSLGDQPCCIDADGFAGIVKIQSI